jgi:FtsP/CotA-like multicopper oxidase with cupredoxin domain
MFDRRHFLRLTGGALPAFAGIAGASAAEATADHTLRIATGLVELGPDAIVSTKLYNGQFPGPLLRMQEGRRVTVDIHNDTDTPEQFHMHGLFLPAALDGAAEEGTPFIPPHGRRRISFVPGPAGFRFYHTHATAGADLTRGLYSGLAGPIYIEPKREPGAYDREVFLTLKEFDPVFTRMEMPADFLEPDTQIAALRDQNAASVAAAIKAGQPEQGFELAYNLFSINGRMLGEGEPVRVRQGERVLFHIVNASATEIRSLALPGHMFRVVALDGNPVPNPAEVPVLWIGTAERVSAIVEMAAPGVWILGDLDSDVRGKGMGVVVEYAGAAGKPAWIDPAPFRWNYARFGAVGASVAPPDETIEMTFSTSSGAAGGFDRFAINGVPFSMERMDPLFRLRRGRRYRLKMRNATDDVHPMHLHRHSFMLTRLAGLPTSGILKDVVMVGKYQEVEVDFTADQLGPSLFHCHMQQHMDFGLMCLFDCS